MQINSFLQQAIESASEKLSLRQLTEAREDLTRNYRAKSRGQFMSSDSQRLAYAIARMPATFAAIRTALKAVRELSDLPLRSLLDLGAGPGTGMWASCEDFESIEKATLIERDASLIEMGKSFALWSENEAIRGADWQKADLETLCNLPRHDFVLLSYSIGELDPLRTQPLIDLAWESAGELLLVVEPGTPAGFERIRKIRSQLIERGAHVLAPCPHHLACPMAGGDWCHFSARVERSSLHRKLKGGSLGYEDEKFSYVAATKKSFAKPPARILREPLRHSGHLQLALCTPQGLSTPTISRKMGEVYKEARKAEWGDAIFLEDSEVEQ